MIKLPKLSDKQLHSIAEFNPQNRSLMEGYNKGFMKASGGLFELGAPHDLITLNTDQLIKGDFNSGVSKTRVFEKEQFFGQMILYSFKNYIDEDAFSGISEVVNDQKYLDNLLKEFKNTIENHNNEPRDSTIKVISIPAILCEVLWLNYDDNREDKYIPIKTVGNLEKGQEYSKAQFLRLSNQLVSQLDKQSDTQGA